MASTRIQFGCVAKGTLVNTPSGYRRVEDINLGDRICTILGDEPVKEIEKHTSIPIFKVTFSDGGEQYVTAGHRYNIVRGKKIEQLRLDEIQKGEYVQVSPCKLSSNSKFSYLDGLRCGILLGDGSITKSNVYSVSVNKKEHEYIKNLRSVFANQFNKLHESKISNSASLQLTTKFSTELHELYKLPQVEGHDKFIPLELMESEDSIVGLIDGLLATDGSIKKDIVSITTTSKKLALGIRQVLLYLGIHGRIYSSFRNDGGNINGRQIIRKHPRYDIYITFSDINKFSKISKLELLHPEKGNKLKQFPINYNADGPTWKTKILNIQEAGISEAFDLYCEQSDTWITEGYVQQGCGEFLPGKKRIDGIFPKIPPPTGNKIPIQRPCCLEIPGKPAVPKPPLEEYVCVCGAACEDNPSQCLEGRGCIRKSAVPPGVRHGRSFASVQECVQIGFGETPCWMCGVKCSETTVPCPPPRPDLPRQIIRQCIACPPARLQTGDCARYPSIRECNIYCRSENRNCPGGPITPVITRPPDTVPVIPVVPVVTRPPIIAVAPVIVRGPITPTPYYRCVQQIEYCPPPFSHVPKVTRQGCQLCWTDLGNGTGRLPDGSIGPRPNNCELTSQQCATRGGINGGPCRNIEHGPCPVGGPITPIGVEPPPIIPPIIIPPVIIIDEPPGTIAGRVGGVGIPGDQLTGNQLLNLLSNNSNLLGQTVDTSLGLTRNLLFEESRKVRILDISEQSKNNYIADTSQNSQSIYHTKYNLIQSPPLQTTKLVSNALYLNIFKDVVPQEIAYILRASKSNTEWSEYPYTQLTKEKVLVALRFDLAKALSNLHYINGKPINIDSFLETLRYLMTTNRLDEFDPTYFTTLYENQKQDELLFIQDSPNQNLKEQAALGIISEEAINADPAQQDDEVARLLLYRSRRLNTDIEAYIPLEMFSGVVVPVPVQEAGLEVVQIAEGGLPILDEFTEQTNYVQLGKGSGYYFSATLENNEIVPLETINNLSSTYYLSPQTRDTVLELFNKDPAIRLRVESASATNEFTAYVTGTELTPLYFRLRLNSVGDIERYNPIVREVSGYYDALTSQTDIDEHIQDYGFNISKVFVDYDDPFFFYASQQKIISFTQCDVSFEGTYPSKGVQNALISRNIAFGIILIPVRGSKYNPFAGRSTLINFESPAVRELTVINDIRQKDIYEAVKENNLHDVAGIYSIGMLETPNTQNIIFSYSGIDATDLYFSAGNFLTDQPDRSYPITHRLIKQILETNISGTYGLSSVTWWDIYRRLTAAEMARIAYELPKTLLDKLASGYRGYRIRHVLQRENINDGSQLGDALDDVILTTATVNTEDPI